MVKVVETGVFVLSGLHFFVGLVSVCVGVVSSIKAEVWLAHSVSPIWSGGFFIITGILGVCSTRRKSPYLIMCFIAISVVSLVTAVVSIQLLRLGLVSHTTDGHTFQKEKKDILILIALGGAGFEGLVCLLCILFGWEEGYNKTSQQLTRKNNTKSKFTTQQKEEKNEPFKGAINDVKIL
ncbi:196-like [Octopus vulgaris]|uniref:196-like n=1 Tax=Octopus vulgaris TaxID=6645 RepID=A0AA36FAI7_OCTVU|nr:196-like [Octopus vulgaris]